MWCSSRQLQMCEKGAVTSDVACTAEQGWASVLNMIRFPDRDPTGFCNSQPDPDRTRFRKNSTGSDLDIQTALITAVKGLIRVFFGYKPDCIKYLDRSSGSGSDRITQWKFWTGLGLRKSPVCSTPVSMDKVRIGYLAGFVWFF